jgi:hypothetical protein
MRERKELLRELRPHATWDIIKEVAKLMLPFLAGLGIQQWVHDHVTALMWTVAIFLAASIAFWDRLAIQRVHPVTTAATLPSRKLQIHSAAYGTGPDTDVPVDEAVKRQPRDGLIVVVSNDALGCDPAFGNDTKRLEVEYSYDGARPVKVSRPQGSRLVLPEDSWAKAELQRLTREIDTAKASLEEIKAEHAKQLEESKDLYMKMSDATRHENVILKRKLSNAEELSNQIWALKTEAREIKRRFPECLFVQAPLDRLRWSPFINQPETGMGGIELEKAIQWHDRFTDYAKGKQNRQYPTRVDFDAVMAMLDRDERMDRGLPA